MPPISQGGAMPPAKVDTAGGGAAAPTTPGSTVAGQSGDAAAGANALGGGAPGSLQEVLTRLVDTLKSLVAALGGAPVIAGAPASATPGGSTMSLLDSASKGGSTDVAQSAKRLADLFRPIASSIDASEAQLVTQAFQNASQLGHVRLSDEMRLIVQVEGTAKGISPEFLAASNKVIDVVARSNEKFDALARQAEADTARTGQVNQLTIQHMQLVQQELQALSTAFNATYDMATTDPAAALARITQAAQQTDPAAVHQALVQPRTA